MGRLAMIIVIGLGVTVSIISLSINKSKTGAVENTAGFAKYSAARNIAHTTVNMALRAIDRGDTGFVRPLRRGELVERKWELMGGGSYLSMRANVSKDTIDMVVEAFYLDTTKIMDLRLRSYPKPFPQVNAAVGLASDNITFQMNGSPHIYGENFDMDGTPGNSAYDTIGVAVKTVAESTQVAGYGSKISGDPQQVIIDPPEDPGLYVQEYISGADYVFADGSNNSGIYGSADQPVIGYCNGRVKFGGGGKFYGVLIVNKSVEFVGTFDVYGLTLCYQANPADSIELTSSTGTPQLWGGVIMSGAGGRFIMKGTSDVRYSVEALEMAKYIGKMQAYQVLRWYE
ncbi:MAG TPA: hypothetical protein VFF29_06345 [Bacteroidota bacterium]|nr:hypothetical protein [Bacteroidota bacterium]